MITDDEYLERIVAGIQSVSTADAEVKWNELINGRQFDVSVRFKLGTLRYLVLIEVRNRTRKASASDVDAFVTKARDQNASKAVFVSAAGFQEGAVTVANRHGIDLFTVTFDENDISLPKQATFITIRNKNAPKGIPPQLDIGEPIPVANIERITLIYDDGKNGLVPDEQSQMNYYLGKTRLSDGRTLANLVQSLPIPLLQLNESRSEEVRIEPPQHIVPPDNFFFPSGVIKSIVYKITVRHGRPIIGNVRVDPNFFTMPVVYTNAVTGESSRFALESLPLGVDQVVPGKFYFTLHPLAYFYCNTIRGSTIEWHLVESFQNGDLMQALVKEKIQSPTSYLPVTDKKILTRLQARLEKMSQL